MGKFFRRSKYISISTEKPENKTGKTQEKVRSGNRKILVLLMVAPIALTVALVFIFFTSKSVLAFPGIASLATSFMTLLNVLSFFIAAYVFFTGKNFPDHFPSGTASPKKVYYASAIFGIAAAIILMITLVVTARVHSEDYTITLAHSDTWSTNFEPAKKIVATASADTKNMVISSKTSTEEYGPFNMTKESERRFSFIAVFESEGTYMVTVTAYSEMGSVATEELVITIS